MIESYLLLVTNNPAKLFMVFLEPGSVGWLIGMSVIVTKDATVKAVVKFLSIRFLTCSNVQHF